VTDPATTHPHSDLRGKRVVICEDEAMTFLHLAKAFGTAGMEVVGSASNGIEAVKVIRHCKPDIVTMDVHMPAMNGIEAIRRITKEHPTCIIVVSAYSDDETVKEAYEAGACGFVHKPITGEGIVKSVEEGYRRHQKSLKSAQAVGK
jgi:DNA-binding NarL/FixJ family response regulator